MHDAKSVLGARRADEVQRERHHGHGDGGTADAEAEGDDDHARADLAVRSPGS